MLKKRVQETCTKKLPPKTRTDQNSDKFWLKFMQNLVQFTNLCGI